MMENDDNKMPYYDEYNNVAMMKKTKMQYYDEYAQTLSDDNKPPLQINNESSTLDSLSVIIISLIILMIFGYGIYFIYSSLGAEGFLVGLGVLFFSVCLGAFN